MKTSSSLKNIGYASLALALSVAATPLLVSSPTYAAACPSNSYALSQAINQRETDISLCGNINGSVDISSNRTYNYSLKLNNHNLTSNGTVIKVRPNSTLTISGNGTVTGTIDANASRLTITGGTYTTDPSNYIKDTSLKAYKDGNKWHVLPKVTLSVSPTSIAMRAGETANITTTGTTNPISYKSNGTSVATVDENGLVTGVALGTTTVTVSTKVYDETISEDVAVSVYDVQPGENDDDAVAADTVKDIIDNEGLPDDMTAASDKVKETFGADYVTTGDNLKDAMNSGALITTNAKKSEATDADAIAKIEQALQNLNVTDVKYYDVSVIMAANGDDIGALKKLDDKLTILLAEVENPAAGYERQYYVVAYHEGDEKAVILTEGTDYIIKDGKIYLTSNRFSTFAVAYKDTLIEEETTVVKAKTTKTPNTGYNTVATRNATSSLVSPVLALGALAAIGTFGVVKFAKRRH